MRTRLPIATLVLLAACNTTTTATTSPSPASAATSGTTVAGCSAAPIPGDLAPTRDAYIAAWQGTDADAVGRFFVEDAVVRTDDQTMTGKVAIISGWIGEDIGKLSNLHLIARSVSQTGADVTERGVMILRFRHDDGTTTNEGGSYTHVWTRQSDGTWRLREARLIRDTPSAC
ncbi:MAG TPA: nuclear transport factor 2 family protein [Longimicrobium sp.]|nr:nuclear transport factor 2 family protein [Longimicrobium sp.]